MNINQQRVKKEEERTEELPPGITLDCEDLTPEQTENLHTFLLKWKNVFLTGVTDLGNCDLIKFEINLSDEAPFK